MADVNAKITPSNCIPLLKPFRISTPEKAIAKNSHQRNSKQLFHLADIKYEDIINHRFSERDPSILCYKGCWTISPITISRITIYELVF